MEEMFGLGPLSGGRARTGAGTGEGVSDAGRPKDPSQMNRFERTRYEEEEEMRKAIEASLADAKERGIPVDDASNGASSSGTPANIPSVAPGAASPLASRPRSAEPSLPHPQAQQPAFPPQSAQPHSQAAATNPVNIDPAHLDNDEEIEEDLPNFDFRNPNAAYDDEDAALQAAIQASLMQFDGELRVPEAPKPVERTPENIAALTRPRGSGVQAHVQPQVQREATPEVDIDAGEDDDEEKKDEESEDDEPEPEPEKLTAEELRKKRLARFGA